LIWMLLHRKEWRRVAAAALVVGLPVLISGLVYLRLLAHLPAVFEASQVVELTHRPDLLRIPEIIGILVVVILITCVKWNITSLFDARFVFTFTLALLPLVLFNQQIITGRSVQPYHYEVFVANYAVLAALVLSVSFLGPIRGRTLLLICV